MKQLMRRPAQRRLAVCVVDFSRMEECDDPTFHRIELSNNTELDEMDRGRHASLNCLLVSPSGRFCLFKLLLAMCSLSRVFGLNDSCMCDLFYVVVVHS